MDPGQQSHLHTKIPTTLHDCTQIHQEVSTTMSHCVLPICHLTLAAGSTLMRLSSLLHTQKPCKATAHSFMQSTPLTKHVESVRYGRGRAFSQVTVDNEPHLNSFTLPHPVRLFSYLVISSALCCNLMAINHHPFVVSPC